MHRLVKIGRRLGRGTEMKAERGGASVLVLEPDPSREGGIVASGRVVVLEVASPTFQSDAYPYRHVTRSTDRTAGTRCLGSGAVGSGWGYAPPCMRTSEKTPSTRSGELGHPLRAASRRSIMRG
jgi:hypothetical protein